MVKHKRFSAPLGASLVILSSFFYASYGIWTTLMGNFFDGYTASALRSVLVVFILVIAAAFSREFEPLKLRANWKYILGMVISSLFTWGPLYFAILEAGIGISLAVTYASIIIGMFFFGWLFASERFTKDKAVSAGLGIIGLLLIFSPTVSGVGLLALFAAFISGLSSAANAVFAKKIHYNPTQSTLVLWLASVFANFLMAFVLSKSFPTFQWQVQWFYLVLFAIASVVASWSLTKGLKIIEAGIAGVLGLLEIVFAVVFGIVFFRERPTAIALLGMLVVIISAAIPYIQEFKSQNKIATN